MLRSKAAAAADRETATDRHSHSHWPDFAYQCNAIVVLLLLLLLLGWLICSQLASLLLHPICNLQHNLCSTTEKWSYWKMTVKRRPPKQQQQQQRGHSLADVHTYLQCLPSSSCHIYFFWSSHTKCLASWDYFLAAALLACLLGKLQHTAFASAPAPKWHAARVDNQASAYKTQCLHLLWHAKRLSTDVSYAGCYVPWPKRPERILS